MRFSRFEQLLAAAVLVSATWSTGCRVDPGETDYESQQIDMFDDGEDAGDDQVFLPGPDPYISGESRLTFGPFYEGASSQQIPVDDVNNFFFIFLAGNDLSLEIVRSSDRIEGFQSDAFRHRGTSFWGMSIAFFDGNPDDGGVPRPEDLSSWETLHISFKSSAAAFDDFEVGIDSSAGEATVSVSDYGYANDGEWHTLEIPLADLDGADLGSVVTPLILLGQSGNDGEELLVDNFYYTGP